MSKSVNALVEMARLPVECAKKILHNQVYGRFLQDPQGGEHEYLERAK